MSHDGAAQDLDEERAGRGIGSTSYELFILIISLISIANLFIIPFVDGAARQVIIITDLTLTLFFVIDFAKRLRASHPRSRYLLQDWGWADLLAILPLFRILRVFRLVRVARKLRAHGADRFVGELRTNRSASAFGLTVALVILVVEVAGAAIVAVEQRSPDANIRTGIDAVWWAYVTITTVGYGDRYPVTTEGRLLGVLLLVAGIALFSVLTAYIAQKLIGTPAGGAAAAEPAPSSAPTGSGDALDEIAELARLADEAGRHQAELRRRIAALEARLRHPAP
ncbi:MAG: ion transporter [Chloroflexota bacterium]